MLEALSELRAQIGASGADATRSTIAPGLRLAMILFCVRPAATPCR